MSAPPIYIRPGDRCQANSELLVDMLRVSWLPKEGEFRIQVDARGGLVGLGGRCDHAHFSRCRGKCADKKQRVYLVSF